MWNNVKFRFARGTDKYIPKNFGFLLWIEDRLSPIFVTICTYPMRFFGTTALFFKRIEDSSRPWGYQFIATSRLLRYVIPQNHHSTGYRREAMELFPFLGLFSQSADR